MATLGPIILALAALIVGCVFKALMNWDDIKPTASKSVRARAMFSQLYLGPDLVLLAFGMLIASQGVTRLLQAHDVESRLGQDFPFWFQSLIFVDMTMLGVTILLWLFAGAEKYIPVEEEIRDYWTDTGEAKKKKVKAFQWRKGIGSKAGMLTIVLGNLLGLSCVIAYGLFIAAAF